MTEEPRSHPKHGEGAASPHKGTAQHGWARDVDVTHTEENPSARRSFHPDEHAPEKGTGRQVSEKEAGNPHGEPVKSTGRRGERQAKAGSDDKGMHDTGPRGRSGRPSGTRDARAVTGVDPQEPAHGGPAH
ncbi:hypothetical protein [Streptomyces sp. WAC06614]|uniref:hypothetical protein n=1 Tax=Streptomyces sp. WAC06614 TaxID=2487416 RepID=UPI000F7971A8|nr:hypothetical protein [Streptomyces sp. WAC06614]RSS84147.1 hypothetical protein EF918_01405 [Streptomyces sp. WAC06614]